MKKFHILNLEKKADIRRVYNMYLLLYGKKKLSLEKVLNKNKKIKFIFILLPIFLNKPSNILRNHFIFGKKFSVFILFQMSTLFFISI